MTTTNTQTKSAAPNRGGLALRHYRKKLGETQGQLGRRYNLTANQISRYERGEYLPDLLLAAQFERDGVCKCVDWSCDPDPLQLSHEPHQRAHATAVAGP